MLLRNECEAGQLLVQFLPRRRARDVLQEQLLKGSTLHVVDYPDLSSEESEDWSMVGAFEFCPRVDGEVQAVALEKDAVCSGATVRDPRLDRKMVLNLSTLGYASSRPCRSYRNGDHTCMLVGRVAGLPGTPGTLLRRPWPILAVWLHSATYQGDSQ